MRTETVCYISSKKWSVPLEIMDQYVGQLEEADLKATMFSTTGGQRMEQILYSKEAIEQLCSLMGIDVEPRKNFVMSKIDFSKYNNS